MAELRKIMSAEEIEKKQQKNKVIMSIVLAVILLFSTAGYFIFDFTESNDTGNNGNIIEHNGVEFSKTDYGTWKFSYGGNNYETYYNPLETENISVDSGFSIKVSNYYSKVLYISADPISTISATGNQEIQRNLGQIIARANYACLADDSECEEEQNYPIKNCSSDNMIIFKESENNKSTVKQNENCAIISYAVGEEEMAADAFLFSLIGAR